MGRTAGKRGPRMARKKGELHLELRATVKVLANAGKNLDEIVELILPMMTTSTSKRDHRHSAKTKRGTLRKFVTRWIHEAPARDTIFKNKVLGAGRPRKLTNAQRKSIVKLLKKHATRNSSY